jgi:hypothetical protein
MGRVDRPDWAYQIDEKRAEEIWSTGGVLPLLPSNLPKVTYDPKRIEGNGGMRPMWGPPVDADRWVLAKQWCKGRVINLGCSGNYGRLRADLHVDIDPGPYVDSPTRPEPFLQADVRHVPQPDDSFDTAVIMEVLEHFNDDQGAIDALREAARLAKRVILSVPREDRLLEKEEWLKQEDSPRNHRLWVSDDRLWGWLRAANLHPVVWLCVHNKAVALYYSWFVMAQREAP